MLPLRISNATRVLAESQDEYHALAIRDDVLEDGTPVMMSLWEPTPEEVEHIKGGGFVRLSILGRGHPPVLMETQPAPSVDDGGSS